MVRVLLDATAIPGDRGGVGRELDSLVPALVDAGADIRVLAKPADADHFAALSGRDAAIAWSGTASRAARLAWEQVGLPALVRRLAADVLHSPHYTLPLLAASRWWSRCTTPPSSPTPSCTPRSRVRSSAPATRLAGSGRLCLIPSQATADELVRVLGAAPARLAWPTWASTGRCSGLRTRPQGAVRARLGMPAGGVPRLPRHARAA